MNIALNGGSGFIGTAVQKKFPNATVLYRDDSDAQLLEKLKNVDVVINLAGAPILKRWTKSYKKTLVQSRIQTTQRLVMAMNQSDVKLFISTSAIGIYSSFVPSDESTSVYCDDFLGQLTQTWEETAQQCTKPTAIVRLGLILGHGGALDKMLPPFKLGLGGTIGDGQMINSWIHIDDLMGLYAHIMEHHLTGVFNATSPHPVTNYTFTKTLGDVLQRPTFLPLPVWVLTLLYGEASSVMTASKEVYPKRVLESEYRFAYPHLQQALENVLKT